MKHVFITAQMDVDALYVQESRFGAELMILKHGVSKTEKRIYWLSGIPKIRSCHLKFPMDLEKRSCGYVLNADTTGLLHCIVVRATRDALNVLSADEKHGNKINHIRL